MMESTSLSRVVYRGDRRRNFVFHGASARATPKRTVSSPCRLFISSMAFITWRDRL